MSKQPDWGTSNQQRMTPSPQNSDSQQYNPRKPYKSVYTRTPTPPQTNYRPGQRSDPAQGSPTVYVPSDNQQQDAPRTRRVKTRSERGGQNLPPPAPIIHVIPPAVNLNHPAPFEGRPDEDWVLFDTNFRTLSVSK